jgi:hypothetical protein
MVICPKVPVLRENSVPADFIGFPSFGPPCFRHEAPTHGGCPTVSQSARLHVVQPVGGDPDSHAQAAAQRVQEEVEEAAAEKQRSIVLGLTLKDLQKR